MSQFFQSGSAVPPPPIVPTIFLANNGPPGATPSGNTISFLADQEINDFDEGITSFASGSTVTYFLTNRGTAQITTPDATPTTIVSIPLGATPGVYYIQGQLVAFNTTDTAGAAYSFSGAARTTGAAATEIASEDKDIFEEVAMATADFSYGVTGNDAFVQVTGITGKTINWNVLITYRFVG